MRWKSDSIGTYWAKFRIPMRGYEYALQSGRLVRAKFRIPMRGYETEENPT